MSKKSKTKNRSPNDRQSEYMRGGKGRKDEIGKSGIYPASAPNAPSDAVVRTPGDYVRHTKPHQEPPKTTKDSKKDRSSGSE